MFEGWLMVAQVLVKEGSITERYKALSIITNTHHE